MGIELAAAYAVVQALHMSANLYISLTCPLKQYPGHIELWTYM